MPVLLQTTAYCLTELPKNVQSRVLERYRAFYVHDDWYQSIYEHADQAAQLLGITINRKHINTQRLCTTPAIYFQGFCSQGDGACFEGHFSSPGNSSQIVANIAAFSPEDVDLLNIAKRIQHLLVHTDDQLTATLTHNGSRYSHPSTICVDAELVSESDETIEAITPPQGIETELTEALRHFMGWIYRKLEREFEYLTSDAQIAEALNSNSFLFTEFGEPAA
ncbi:hypothetical protein PsAD2_03006 [Pseudovibrio axinellae]|uniref:Uncharacterized protein n=1 Tax=Pseudovibrio axinellae TaxID=989403 RepID=A0A165XG13_9HYPH|nr:hypothetical protein [Pseudovibrio axinellae]KZL17670.1 hypothetical protein PsAD2_03006 [Pseudovibrio axinellae]SER44258.1 hypothetical protein SAMN05421798_11076 [Pseudovibrio axinellae]